MKYDPKLVDSAFVSQLLDREISLLLSQNSPLINVLNNIHGASVDKISQDRLMYLAPFVQCSLFNQSLSVVDVFKTFVPGRSIAEIIIDANHVTFLQYLPRTMASDAIEYAVKRGFPIVPSLWGILDQEGQEYLFQQGLLSRLLSYQRQGKLRLLCDFIQCCFEKNYLFIIEFLINQPGLSLPVLLHAVRYSPNVKETTSRLVEFYKGDLIELFSLAVCRVVNGKRRQRAKISPDQFVDFILTLLSMIESENNSLALLVEPIHTLYNSPFFQSTPQLASFLMAFSLRHDLQCVLTSGVSNPKLKGSLSIANETIPLFSLNQVQDRLFQVVNAFSQCERVFLHADSGYQPLTIMFKGTWLLLCHQKQILKKSGLLSTLWSFVDFQTPSCQSSASSEKPSFLCQRHNDMRLLTGMIHVDSPQKKQKGMRLNLLSSHLTFISNSKQYFSSDRNMPGNIVTPVTLLGNVANDKGSISVPHQLKLLGGIANKLVCYFEHQQARVKSKPNLALFNTRFCVLMKSIDQVKKSMRSDAMKKM